MEQEKLTRAEAAEYLGVKKGTMAVWACIGRYVIPYFKVNQSVYYLKKDLDHFVKTRKKWGQLKVNRDEGE